MKAFVVHITELYTVVGIVLQKSNHFTFRYLDSGSSFLAGLLSQKEVAETVRILVNQWFDRVRFWKYDTYDRKLESFSKTLDVVAKLHQQVQDGAISSEDGRILTERTLAVMEVLSDIGVTPVVIGGEPTVERQQYLNEVRKMKMLTGTTEVPAPDSESKSEEPPSAVE